MNRKNPPPRKAGRVLLWIYGAALLYYILKQCYYAVWVGGFPDQMAQLSYIIHMAKAPALVPDLPAMQMWETQGVSGGLTVFSPVAGSVNYLNHPTLYYLMMAFLGGVRILPDGTAVLNLMWLRALNILLSASAMALACYMGYTRLQKRSPLTHAVYAAAITTLPMLAYSGAGVNNDNLATLALVVFFTGLVRYQEDKLNLTTYLLIGLGFLAGSFSKLTTALIFILALTTVLVMSIIKTRSLRLVANRWFLITLPCYLLFLGYELVIHSRYGTWQPSLLDINPEYYYTSIFYVAPENRVPMNVWQFARHFLGGIGYTWSSLYGHNRTVTEIMNNGLWGLIYWIVPAVTLFVLVRGWITRKDDRICLPVLAAFFGTMAYHFYSHWKGYPVSGYLGGAQARYYLAMIVPMAYLVCERFPSLSSRWKKTERVLAALLIAGWLAGDAIRLVILYGFPATV